MLFKAVATFTISILLFRFFIPPIRNDSQNSYGEIVEIWLFIFYLFCLCIYIIQSNHYHKWKRKSPTEYSVLTKNIFEIILHEKYQRECGFQFGKYYIIKIRKVEILNNQNHNHIQESTFQEHTFQEHTFQEHTFYNIFQILEGNIFQPLKSHMKYRFLDLSRCTYIVLYFLLASLTKVFTIIFSFIIELLDVIMFVIQNTMLVAKMKKISNKFDLSLLLKIVSNLSDYNWIRYKTDSIENLLGRQTHKNKSVYGWMFDTFIPATWTNVLLYPVTSIKSRIRSFTSLIQRRSQKKFFNKLAIAGFRYNEISCTVICENCGKEETLENFKSHPGSSTFHFDNCTCSRDFLQAANNNVLRSRDINSHADEITESCSHNLTLNSASEMMKENLTFPANVSEETHHALENNCFKDDNFKDYNFKDAERFMHNNTEVDGAPYYICEDTNTEMDVTPFSAREATLNTKPSSYNSYPDISKKLTDPILEKKIPDESFEENEIFFVSEIQQLDLNDIRNEKFSQVETKFESGSGTSTYTREIGNRTSTYTKEWIDDSVTVDDPVKECTASRPSSSSGYSSLDSESSYEREPKQIDRYELSVNKYDYTAEFIISDLHYQQININSASDINQCLRNPNHLNFIDLHSLNLESLPKKLRCQGIGRMLELISLLTVKVSWKKYNDGRGLLAISTGSVFDCEIQPISLCGHVYIKTSVNHINSDTEAKHCLVEFFSGSSLSAKRLKGEAIERMPGDSKVYLKCPTFDLNFIKYIKMIQTELRDMVQMLPTQVKRVLTTKVLMVSLLHGGHKVISYGSSTVLKYQLVEYQDESDGQTRFRLEKVTDIVKGVKNKHLVRKMLLYSADACPGSCGAPVVRFRSVTTDCADNVTYQLDTWMHHGYHKDEDLNVSYVKECTEEDFYDWDWVQKANRGQDDPLIISVTQSIPQQLYNPEASHPYNNQTTELSQPPPATFSFIEHPSYPAYITIQQRLLSYSNWISNNIHKPTQLAEAGFFYAGYSDCVRCFCCGLGLRSWKPGDDIYVEHERYRPTCSFLRQHLLSNASLWQQRDHMTRLDVSHVETNLGCAGTTANAHSDKPSPRKYLETLVHNIQVPAVSATVCAVSAEQSHVIGVVSQDGGLQTRRNAPSDATATITSSQYDSTVSSQLADTGLNQNVSREDLNVTLNLLKQENEALQGMTKCKRCQVRPINILFLPCGELYACSECADKVQQCPSCGQRILGTVTTYFS